MTVATCTANTRNKKGVSLLFAFLTPVLLFLLLHLTAKEPTLWIQLALFASVCVLLWYTLRFCLCTFTYSVDVYEEEGAPILLVYSTQGKRKSLLFRLSLDCLHTLLRLTSATRKKAPRSKRHCNACFNLCPDTLVRLTFMESGTPITVDLEADEAFTLFLENYLTDKERDLL